MSKDEDDFTLENLYNEFVDSEKNLANSVTEVGRLAVSVHTIYHEGVKIEVRLSREDEPKDDLEDEDEDDGFDFDIGELEE